MKTRQCVVQMWRMCSICLMLILWQVGQGMAASDLDIRHEPLLCAVAGTPIAVSAEIITARSPQEVRIYFKAQQADQFYFTSMRQKQDQWYTGIIPAPTEQASAIEYLLLVITEETAVKTSPFLVVIHDAADCPVQPIAPISQTIYAEEPVTAQYGFDDPEVSWKVGTASEPAYFATAKEVPISPPMTTLTVQSASSKKFPFGTKTAIGVGAGLGAAAAIGVAVSGDDGGGGGSWAVDSGDVASTVTAQLTKVPTVQTTCGTIVSNQLYVTNSGAEEILIGTIDYEVLLTTDNPRGSCAPGHIGAFAPNLALTVAAGATEIVREWSNEVNPCSECPFLSAECSWLSRYVVHTSAGSALAEATFTVQGDLCNGAGAKTSCKPSVIQSDAAQ